MATESPIRIMETCQNWPSHKEAASMTMGDEGHKYNGRSSAIPNRSGSAPPSMEGSLAAMEDLMQSSDLRTNFFSLSRDSETGVSGDRLIPYSSSISKFSPNVSSNPQFQHSFGRGFSGPVGNLWKFSSFDDSSNSFLRLSRGSLPTHREEPEDDRSPPQQSSDDWMVGGSTVWRGPGLPSSISQNKNMADLIQDNLHPPSSPSNNQPSITRHLSKGDAANHDDSNGSTQKTSIDDISSSNTDHLTGPVSRTSSRDCTEGTLNIHLNDEPLDGDNPDITSIQSAVQTLKISTAPNLDSVRGWERTQLNHQNNLGQHLIQQQHHQNIHAQFPNSVPQLPRGMNSAYAVTNQVFRGEKFSPTEVQPVLQSSGFTPPLYASTAPYMPSANPYFSTIQAPGLIYSPQYGLGGYGFNAGVVPPYLAGYPPNAGIPLTFDARASGFPPGGSSSHAVDMQHMNKFRGQLGLTQTSFPDPRVPFNQQFGDFCGTSNQVDPSKLRGGIFGTHVSALESHKVSDFALSNVNQRAPAHTGFLMQIPTTSIASPVLPGSPIGGSTVPGGINDANFPLHASKSPSFYGGWHHQGGFENVNYSKPYSILEELKSGKGRRFELSDIAGHVVEFSVDQHGSRFIQQKLENCSSESKASVFQEVLPHTSKLMTDVFGNYVIQKFFDYGTSEQRKELANQLAGQILPLSLQMYGCRVIQKALEVIELNQKTELVRELDGHVIRCVRDQNGNHVIQKCIESIPTEKIGFIITAFRGQIETLSKHPYGCRVIQRVLEHCTDELQSQFIVDEILESVGNLAQDQYGNYVIQHVLQRGTPEERTKIIRKLSGKVVEMSQHKFASNVVEKCLEHGDAYARELLIVEVIGINDGTDNLLVMMKDQYANYVVQKILETCTDNQRDLLLGRIRVHLHALKKYTYGKHIVARFEQLFGEI